MDGFNYANEKATVCTEYFLLRSLSEIGFVFRPDDLSADRAMDYHIIAGELAVLRAERFERETKKKGKK